jgi:glycosyltransferase involved in cell wall biosynthesis
MTNQKKIAFLCHPYHRGGVTRWMADAAIGYAKKGYETYFITPDPVVEFYSGKGRETMVQLLAKTPNNVKIVTVKVGREFEFGTPAYNAHTYKKLILENVPQGTPIILSDDPTVWQSACTLNATYPIVGVLHADEPHYYKLAEQHKNEVAIFVCVSARVSRLVKEKSPSIDPSEVFIVPCGIELPPVENNDNVNAAIQLVYVGRITDYQKRSGDLAKVATQLQKQNIPFHLNIIGDGLEPKIALQKKIQEDGLQEQITFTGWLSQSEVHNDRTTSDVLILTSDFEGMPIAMMEGLASGCGFVGTRVSGIEDYENHPLAKDCFRVFEVGDIETAITKIQEVAAVPINTRKEAARKLAEEQFSMDICLGRYNKAIATIPAKTYVATSISLSLVETIKSKITSGLRALKMKGK